jgi:serine/threonine protein phosphatase PrpC
MGILGLSTGLATDTGPRPRNEDFASIACAPPQAEGRGTVAAVADGMGGPPGGQEAATMAVEGFIEAYFRAPADQGVHEAAMAAVAAVNARIYAESRRNPRLQGMGTTLTVAILIEEGRGYQVHIAHVGDSRAFLLRAGRLEALTAEHNLGYRGLPHVLTRAVGTTASVEADYSLQGLALRERLLLCTDGVSGVLPASALARLTGSGTPQAAAEAVVAAARAAGSLDNATALVIEAEEDGAVGA